MGFVKRSLELEEFLDLVKADWQCITDQEYKNILFTLNEFIDQGNYWTLRGDEAFSELQRKLPLEGYIFNAPKHKLFSIYENGNENKTVGYFVKNLSRLSREKLNHIECVVTNTQLTFACILNHEWQAMCPEIYIEKNA